MRSWWQAGAAVERGRQAERLFVLQCVSGPSLAMVVRSLPSYARRSNLRSHAISLNEQLVRDWIPEWMSRFRSGELRMNIVLLDFATLCPDLVQTIIRLNMPHTNH